MLFFLFDNNFLHCVGLYYKSVVVKRDGVLGKTVEKLFLQHVFFGAVKVNMLTFTVILEINMTMFSSGLDI